LTIRLLARHIKVSLLKSCTHFSVHCQLI